MNLIILLLLLCLFGCKYQDVEDHSLVLGVSIDYENDGLTMGFEILERENESYFVEVKGNSIEECFDRLDKENPALPYLNHCSIVIIGKGYAERGIMPLLEYIMHDPDFRLKTNIVVSKELAKDVLMHKGPGYKIISNDISMAFELALHKTNIVDPVSVFEAVDQILFQECILLPVVSVDGDYLDISGGVVFYYDQLKEFLDKDKVSFLKLINGDLKGGLLSIGDIGLDLKKTTFNVSFKNNKVTIKGKITTLVFSNPDVNLIEKLVIDKIEESLAIIKELGCDVLSFKEKIYQTNFSLYMQVNESFSEYFNNLEYSIDVSFEIKDPGYAYGDL